MFQKFLRVTVGHRAGSFLTMMGLGISVTLISIALVTSYTSSAYYFSSLQDLNLDVRQLENTKIDKVIIEQDDGSINLVFHIPSDLQINRHLKHASIRTIPPMKLLNSSWFNITQKPTNNRPSNKISEKLNLSAVANQSALSKRVNTSKVDDVTSTTAVPQELPTSFPVTVQENMYLINSKNICSKVKNLLFLVLVHTSTVNFQRRNNIRETWANSNLFQNYSMRIVFLLGKPKKDSTQALIDHESVLHGDIVQGNFIDDYHNLTHKGVLGLRWVTENCRQAKAIVKVDDDVFLNIFKLMDDMVTEYSNISRKILCPVRPKGTSEIQRKSGKWKVDDREFFNMTHFPVTYCNGFFAVVTGDIIPELYEAAKVTPFFWVDDVYIFGLLPDKVGNIIHTGLSNLNLNEPNAIKCFESTETPCALLVANAHSEGVMDKLWYGALAQHKQLAKRYIKASLFNKR